ncbi:uncharacterized protein LOC136032099 isoform X2 [Artemia franciscana]|uniref:Tetraspanin n=1 Tax=Artemia franciscana TaxID=6661 RepID=A0AA88LKT8_ARTSF|nr:hypothetical protein QYM36_000230 [Artemia franciscana]
MHMSYFLQPCRLFFQGHRLDTKLVRIYWYLVLCFLGSDIVTGAVWMIKFEGQMSEFTERLKEVHLKNYGNKSGYTSLWDEAQKQLRCCGIESPSDYKFSTEWANVDFRSSYKLVPKSCCVKETDYQLLIERPPQLHELEQSNVIRVPSGENKRKTKRRRVFKVKAKAGKVKKSKEEEKIRKSSGARRNQTPTIQAFRRQSYKKQQISLTESPPFLRKIDKYNVQKNSIECHRTSYRGEDIYQIGCVSPLAAWLQQSAAVLFVLNYCVLAFVKVCFLAILRHELKEMIQKIELLKTQDTAPLFPELAAALGLNKLSPQPTRKTIGPSADITDNKETKNQIPNGIAESEPLLFSNHIHRNFSGNGLPKEEERRSEKDSSVQNAVSSQAFCDELVNRDSKPLNNNDYYEMKELKGKNRQTEI